MPFVPTVPFPAPSALARRGPRVETDPIERASTAAFAENETQDRQEDSTLALLRGVGDATGLVEAPPEFDSKTAESGLLAGRPGTQPDELVTGTIGKVNPTDLDLPVVKPPAAEDDAARAEPAAPRAEPAVPPDNAGAAAVEPNAKPDRLSRGLRAFGFRPTTRDQAGRLRSTGNLPAEEPAGAFERPLTSPLIPPPAPASAAPGPAPGPAPAAASPTAGSPAPAATPSEPATAGESAKLPISTASSSLPPPSEKQSATSGPSPACPQCEAPMAWVEEHLRFYCKSCKMYF